MSPTVKTATIPFLSTSRYRSKDSAGDTMSANNDVCSASEAELAELSESTLTQLRDRVRDLGSDGQQDAITQPTVANESQEIGLAASDGDHEEPPTQPTPAEQVNQATQQLVDIVLERSSPGVPVVLLFVGSEPNHHVDEMTARVASALCDHTDGRVLLIDSDSTNQNLTTAARQASEDGITEVIERDQSWQTTLLRNQAGNLDFMPSGNGQFGRWNEKELLRKAVCEMKSEYPFVCVAGGDAHSRAAKLWSDVCDGSYLLVSVKNSNGTVAKSAVAELQASGARLLGCVVTDVD